MKESSKNAIIIFAGGGYVYSLGLKAYFIALIIMIGYAFVEYIIDSNTKKETNEN